MGRTVGQSVGPPIRGSFNALSVDKHGAGLLLSVDRSVFAVSVGKSAVRPVLLGDASCRPSIKVPYSHHRTVGESVGRCVVRQQTHCYCRSVGPVFVSERVVCSVLSVGASCRSVGKGAVPSVGRWVIHRKTYCWRVIISRSARGRGGEGAWRGGRDKGREVERADRGRVEHTLSYCSVSSIA